MTYLVTPKQTLAAARQAGLGDEQLTLSDVAVLTFSKAVMDRLEILCGLEEACWIGPQHHPYAAARLVKRGACDGVGITAVVPPMGSSPLACIVEDLVACGARAVFLICAAWSLGPPVQFGDLIIPSFSLGPDGTSCHYGNSKEVARASPEVVQALTAACREKGVRYHSGGNGSCEAIYRVTPGMAAGYKDQDCLCMDNGEASTLFAITRRLGVLGGALFQPYIDLAKGWRPSRLRNACYQKACHLQAEIFLVASTRLVRWGLIASIGNRDERENANRKQTCSDEEGFSSSQDM